MVLDSSRDILHHVMVRVLLNIVAYTYTCMCIRSGYVIDRLLYKLTCALSHTVIFFIFVIHLHVTIVYSGMLLTIINLYIHECIFSCIFSYCEY